MNNIGIIGLGRFGKVLVSILQKGYKIYGYDKQNIDQMSSNLKELYNSILIENKA